MSERGPNKIIGFSDYRLAGQVEVPPETPLADGFAYTRDEVQEALGGGSDKFVLNIVEADLGEPELE